MGGNVLLNYVEWPRAMECGPNTACLVTIAG